MEGDSEANYAYYAFHEHNILPHDLMEMSRRKKAAIYAMIDFRIKKEKRDIAKAKKKR